MLPGEAHYKDILFPWVCYVAEDSVIQVLCISACRWSLSSLSHSAFLLCSGWHSGLCSHMENQRRKLIQLKNNQPKYFYIFQSDTFSATQVVVLTWQGGISVNREMRGWRQGGICSSWPEQHCLPNFKRCSERCTLAWLLSLVLRSSLNRQGRVQKRGRNFFHAVLMEK